MAVRLDPETLSIEEIFDEVPVKLREFIEGEYYLNVCSLSDKQFEAVLNSTQIYHPDTLRKLGWDVLSNYTEIVLQWGKGSGKDFVSVVAISYVFYLLICLKSPQDYYGKARITAIDMINMAFGAPQAHANFFAPFKAAIESSVWFQEQHIKVLKDYMEHSAKRIRAFSGHSFGGAVEGKNLIFAVLDEISEFKTQKEIEMLGRRSIRAPKYSAESLYDVIRSSIDSRFTMGKLVLLSYPRYKGCYIQQKYAAALQDPNAYASFGCTWDINPTKKRSDFDIEYRRNPERCKAKYECNPSSSEDAFFKNASAIEKCFPIITEDQSPVWDEPAPRLKPWFKANHDYLCAMHIDLARKHCRAGIGLAHQSGIFRSPVFQQETGGFFEYELPIITLDLLTSFEAPIGGEIDFEKVRTFVKELRNRGFRISLISFDGYESVDMTQHLTKAGFTVIQRSMDKTPKPYEDLKTLIYECRLQGGYCMERSLVIDGIDKKVKVIHEELSMLVDIRGKKVDHVAGGSKDESDALAGAVAGALEIGLWRAGDSIISTGDVAVEKSGRYDPQKLPLIPGVIPDGMYDVPENAEFRGVPFAK